MNVSKTKTLIVGSGGFLGQSLRLALNTKDMIAEAVNRSIIDLNNLNTGALEKFLKNGEYHYIIICAAITDIEKCFRDQKISNQVNVDGTIKLLDAIQESEAIPVFFSSDYVYKSVLHPRKEEDVRDPGTLYGKQKLAVERYLEKNFKRFLIFRTSKLMSKTNHAKNILFPMIQNLRESKPVFCFEDQWINPIFIEDIAEVFKVAHKKNLQGDFNLGTRRIFSRFELGRFIAAALGLNPDLVRPVKLADIQVSEVRPHYNTLDCRKVEMATDFRFTEIEDAIGDLRLL